MQRVRTLIIAGILGAALAACGGTNAAPTTAPATPNNGSNPTPTASAATPTSAQGAPEAPASDLNDLLNNKGETIALTITGGENAGTYAVTSDEGACSYGLAGEGAGWGNQYSITTSDPKELSSLQLIAANIKAGENSTDQFLTSISFGELFGASEKTYEIKNLDGSGKDGSGTVTINDKGETATITIKGETADGIGIEATIECLSVIRLSGDSGSDGPVTPANGLRLTIAGGDLAGSYDLTPSGEVSQCGAGDNNGSVLIESLEEGKRSDNLTFEYLDENEKLRQVDLLVSDASAGATSAFYLNINDQAYYVENLSGGDDSVGTVKVDEQIDSATISIDAKTADGSTIKGTIVCNSIAR